MVPRYTAKVPYLGAAIRRQEAEYRRQEHRSFDFGRAYWTPPLAPRQAYRLEEKQIQRQLRLPALVSLTDHDDIRAGSQLQLLERFSKVPISTEWTIPFGPTFFHLGVHNLRPSQASGIYRELADFTAAASKELAQNGHAGFTGIDDSSIRSAARPRAFCASEEKLPGLLEMLNSNPDTLLVLNHPLWDEKGVGAANHAQTLGCFLERYSRWLHALEINGLRSWGENKQVITLGRQLGLPLVSGGDRHGREPNAILNLSKAATFAEFAQEIRCERFSHLVFMPQYQEPLKLRILQTMVDIVREYPENFAGRKSWDDRIFYRDPTTNIPHPLAAIWGDGSGPRVVAHFIAFLRLLEWRGVRSALRIALNDRASVWSDREATV